jgi:hypothetical protein
MKIREVRIAILEQILFKNVRMLVIPGFTGGNFLKDGKNWKKKE